MYVSSHVHITPVQHQDTPDSGALQVLRNQFPETLLKYLPLEKLYALPEYIMTFSEKERDYNHFPFSDETPDAVRGIMGSEPGRVFIAVRYVDESEETPITKCDTLFQRFEKEKENWSIANKVESHVHKLGGMSSSDFEYLSRLITGQPCGSRESGAEGTKTFRGTSIVHLGQAQKLQTILK